ncbi:glycosyltransferase family 39 protein [Candidatus Woesebacteria bacterium]|nr:glycosyltransferase family 39 protein [Candidatus Woesebacteria bacterium]
MKKKTRTFFIPNIVTFLLVGLGVRLILSSLPAFEIDMNTWLAWAWRLKELGPAGFYTDSFWTQYTPGYLYFLWAIGKLGLVNEFVIKLSVIFADIVTALIIRKVMMLSRSDLARRYSNLAFLLYVLNPVVVFTGSVWGQIDGVMTLFLVASSYFIIEKKKPALAGLFWGLAFLIKPQTFVFLPPILFIAFLKKFKPKDYVGFLATSAITVFLLSLPFFPNDPILGLPRLIEKMTGYYNYTSVFAFNFWSVVVGMWQPDNGVFLGLAYQLWGTILYLLALSVVFFRFRGDVQKKNIQYLIIALSLLASFLLPTRVHERYLFPMFAFLLISAGLSRSKMLMGVYLAISSLNFLNLYHPYAYYSKNFLRNETLLDFTDSIAPFLAILSLVIFVTITGFLKKAERVFATMIRSRRLLLIMKAKSWEGVLEGFPRVNLSQRKVKYLLFLVLGFAFVTRVFGLSSPPNEYFDEVYHAFTARQMLHGNPRAWDWLGTPPEGFAYEWTHPPVAKLGMIVGMIIFGENSFGWRIPGAVLGVVSVYLVYLIAKTVFRDEFIGVLAAGVFSLDGLSLVISRIGMNDIYFLTFALASFYFFLRNRNFASAIFLGLSVSSKWSAIWLLPILFAANFIFKKRLSWSYLWLIVLPPLIYLASYIPFFAQGYTFRQFFNINAVTNCFGQIPCDRSFGLQQQMWWYHTNLNATHPYTSSWWSWPLNARPVYLYTSETVNGMVSRIYLIGNPFVFWFGFLGILTVFYRAFRDRPRKHMLFVIFAYLIFFVPWALSPRIMFLYHYLPSIPFMAISLAYLLRRYPKAIAYLLVPSALVFLYFYPHWAGLWIPEALDTSYYWFVSWR